MLFFFSLDDEGNEKPERRKKRFSSLADKISHWEDDTNHPVHRKKKVGIKQKCINYVRQRFLLLTNVKLGLTSLENE